MTRLKITLSIMAMFITHCLLGSCPSDAKAKIVNLDKQGNQLILEYIIEGRFSYNVESIEVINRSLGGNTILSSISGDLYELVPDKKYKIIWNVKEDVDIIEDIQRSDFEFQFVMTDEACTYFERWHKVHFGTFLSPFGGFTFGNKSASRGLGLAYEFGIYLDKKIGENTRVGIDVFYAQQGMGIDRSRDVIFNDKAYDMKNIRLRIKSFNFAPNIRWKLENSTFYTGLNFKLVSNAKLKLKADPVDGRKEKIKVPVFESTEIFEYASINAPLKRFSTGWFIGFDWSKPSEKNTFYVKIGGQFTDLMNQSYWFFPGAAEQDVLDFSGNSLKFTYIQFGTRWNISGNLVKYKK